MKIEVNKKELGRISFVLFVVSVLVAMYAEDNGMQWMFLVGGLVAICSGVSLCWCLSKIDWDKIDKEYKDKHGNPK